MSDITDWPDWSDAGRKVRLTFVDKAVEGTLVVDDFFENDGDEVPIFAVIKADGSLCYFAAADTWQFLN